MINRLNRNLPPLTFKIGGGKGTDGTIKGLDSDNVLITPKGESSLMPNQRVEEGDFAPENLLLEIGGREIEHFDIEALLMQLLMEHTI